MIGHCFQSILFQGSTAKEGKNNQRSLPPTVCGVGCDVARVCAWWCVGVHMVWCDAVCEEVWGDVGRCGEVCMGDMSEVDAWVY